RYLIDKYGGKTVFEGGLKVYTTLNRSMQKAAERAVTRGLEELGRRQGYDGPLERIARSGIPAFLETLDKHREKRHKEQGSLEGESIRGVVTSIASNGRSAEVAVGTRRKGTLALADMAWARPPNPKRAAYHIRSVKNALAVGDVILVRVKEEEGKKDGKLAFELTQEPLSQAALLSIDPRTAQVKAWVGGSNFRKTQFDRVFQSRRQPGSAFKPFVYATALDRGFTPSTIIIDSPVSFVDAVGTVWSPKNYDKKFKGPLTVRDALAHSRNVPAVKVAERTGIVNIIDYAHRLGISSPLKENLSLALGSAEVTLFELTRAYGVFAAGGKRIRPVFIRKILDRDGQIIGVSGKVPDPNAGNLPDPKPQGTFYDRLRLRRSAVNPADFPPGNVLSRSTAYQITDLLQGVVRYGTGRKVQKLGRPAAGKTGTTNGLRDAWFMGFTPQLVTGVWVGFDEEQPIGYKETGGRTAAPIWLYYMEKALEGEPVMDFEVPETITFARVNYNTGLPAGEDEGGNTIFEAYKQGQEPPVRREGSEGASYTAGPPRPPPVDFFRRAYR
ncbi:MAG: penicillin-binding protein 1A, partial [Myxococcota bacterium]